MMRNNEKQAPYWRLVAILPVVIMGFITAAGSGCGGNGGNGDGNTRFEEQEPFSFDVTVDNQDQFKLLGVNGEITITGKSGADSVTVTGTKSVQSKISAADAKEYLKDLKVNSESFANEVQVETDQPQDTAERNYTVDYTITLPTYFKVQVNSVNGVVRLDSIDNDVTVNMANADVTLRNIHGSAAAHLANGTIDGEVVLPLQGTIDMSTATGGIKLAIPANTSATFSATAAFGSVNYTNLVFQDKVENSHSLSGTLGDGDGDISLRSMGDISVSGF